jgi:hypothetical protein
MNLFNIKKITCVAGILLAALTTQQTLAAGGYLFCAEKDTRDGSTVVQHGWEWSQLADKQLAPEFNYKATLGYDEIGYKYNYSSVQKNYLWLIGNWKQISHNGGAGKSTLFLGPKVNAKNMNETQAKGLCMELKNFCPNQPKNYTGAGVTGDPGWYHVGVEFEVPGQQNLNQLICPAWDDDFRCGLVIDNSDYWNPKVTTANIGACIVDKDPWAYH